MSDIDQQEILKYCHDLEAEVLQIRSLKLNATLEQFQILSKQQFHQHLQIANHQITTNYTNQKEQLNKTYQQYKAKCNKNREQINKQILAFEAILEELSQRKMTVQVEFEEKVSQVYGMKEKNIQEWKKHSNEDLKKSCLKEYTTGKKERQRI